ncbi:MAG: type II toxin-antitoxin system VapC family toxin [Deltaproteobacteria bacterium]|nr:type II toxin-antitoxin system VapC family toxin [Deltaproteobacteria bacterium]
MTYYLDTNICIYALKGVFPEIKNVMMRIGAFDIKIPSIVNAELKLGAKKSNNPEKAKIVLAQFLSPYEIIPFDEPASLVYAEIRGDLEKAGKVIGPNDLIIAATVLSRGGTLITHNTKEFKRIKNLKIEDWTLRQPA